jgi:hypothetical protein
VATAPSSGPGFNGGTITTALGVTVPDSAADQADVLTLRSAAGLLAYVESDGLFQFTMRRSSGNFYVMDSSPTKLFEVSEHAGVHVHAVTWLDLRTVAAPADGSMVNSSVALWLDDTPAATKLMVKAKDSAGTVRTAAIALT